MDYLIANDSEKQQDDVKSVFIAIAVMESDFDEGISKEETAKKWLGKTFDIVKDKIRK